MSCSSGCPNPGAHKTLGECLRDKGVKVAYADSSSGRDYSSQKKWDRDLDAYKSARAEGIQPKTTKRGDVEAAKKISDITGVAFQA